MNIRSLFLCRLLVILGLGAAAAIAAPTSADVRQPNIVFIFSDDHSLQTIGAYEARLSKFCREQSITPNLDRLAAAGGAASCGCGG